MNLKQLLLHLNFVILCLVCGFTLSLKTPTTLHAQTAPKTIYVSPTGNDTNAGTSEAPLKSINVAVTKLLPGDTLLLKDGIYTEAITNTIPPGESWTKPVTIKAEHSRQAIVRPATDTLNVLQISVAPDAAKQKKYIILEGLVLDGVNVSRNIIHISGGIETEGATIYNPRFIRIVNNEIMHSASKADTSAGYKAYGMGILNARGDDIEILRNDIHDNGQSDFDHGIYNYGRRTLIDGNRVYDNRGSGIKGGWGYNSIDVVIRNNIVYDNNKAWEIDPTLGQKQQGRGISFHYGDNVKIYNNVVWGAHVAGIDIIYDVEGAEVYNNTVYVTGSKTNASGISVGGGSEGNDQVYNTVVKNNVVVTNTTISPNPYNNAIFAGANNNNTLIQNNLTFGTNSKIDYKTKLPTLVDNFINVDPKFVNAGAHDFRLTSTSGALDKGENLYTKFTTDILGNSRPSTGKFDLGAYEFGNTASTPAPSSTSTKTPTITPSKTPTKSPTQAAATNTPAVCSTDFNQDNTTDLSDYSLLVNNFLKTGTGLTGDVNRDNVVDLTDYSLFVGKFLKPC